MWRWGDGDRGYGQGWRLQAGSLTPSWMNTWGIHHYTFIDATGAEYRLDARPDGTWASSQGAYVNFNPLTGRLYFPDGSFWLMGAVSSGNEEDAGTYYPTVMQDSNGNQIVIRYLPGTGVPAADTSGRIWTIEDARATQLIQPPNQLLEAAMATYHINYYYLATIPHATEIRNTIGSGESYSLTYGAFEPLTDPYGLNNVYDPVWRLSTVGVCLANGTSQVPFHRFTYSNATEMLSMDTPLGGRLSWTYRTHTYTGSRSYREVQIRNQQDKPGGPITTHEVIIDPAGGTQHGWSIVANWNNQTQKAWGFGNSGAFLGNVSLYEERGQRGSTAYAPLVRKGYAMDAGRQRQPVCERGHDRRGCGFRGRQDQHRVFKHSTPAATSPPPGRSTTTGR